MESKFNGKGNRKDIQILTMEIETNMGMDLSKIILGIRNVNRLEMVLSMDAGKSIYDLWEKYYGCAFVSCRKKLWKQ